MSYFEPSNFGTGWTASNSWSRVEILTPMIYDIKAIQAYYGVDTTTRTGNTTYGFNSTADRSVYTFQAAQKPVLTIWDAAGALDSCAPDENGMRYATADELHALWTRAGLSDVAAGEVVVAAGYSDFEDLWAPLVTARTARR